MFMVQHFPEDAHAMCMTNSQLQMQMVNASTFNGWPPSRSKYTKKKLVYEHNSTSPSYVCWFIFANPRVCAATSSYLGGPHLSIGLTSHFLGPETIRILDKQAPNCGKRPSSRHPWMTQQRCKARRWPFPPQANQKDTKRMHAELRHGMWDLYILFVKVWL